MQNKIFIRSLCRTEVDWDQQLDEEFQKSWRAFCGNFEEVSGKKFPRRTFNSDGPIKLYVSDTSKKAYGCVFYTVKNTQRHFPKVKVSPLKEKLFLLLSFLLFSWHLSVLLLPSMMD